MKQDNGKGEHIDLDDIVISGVPKEKKEWQEDIEYFGVLCIDHDPSKGIDGLCICGQIGTLTPITPPACVATHKDVIELYEDYSDITFYVESRNTELEPIHKNKKEIDAEEQKTINTNDEDGILAEAIAKDKNCTSRGLQGLVMDHSKQDNGKGEHYSQAPFDVLQVQGYVAENYYKYISEGIDGEIEYSAMQEAWCIGSALKHLLRLGLKGDPMLDLYKAENYIHKVRTGEWLEEKK